MTRPVAMKSGASRPRKNGQEIARRAARDVLTGPLGSWYDRVFAHYDAESDAIYLVLADKEMPQPRDLVAPEKIEMRAAAGQPMVMWSLALHPKEIRRYKTVTRKVANRLPAYRELADFEEIAK